MHKPNGNDDDTNNNNCNTRQPNEQRKKTHQLFAEYLLSAICVRKGGGNLRLALLPHIPSVCLTIFLESSGFYFAYLSFVSFRLFIRCILVFFKFGAQSLDCIRNSNCIQFFCSCLKQAKTTPFFSSISSVNSLLSSVARPMCLTF